MPDGNDIAQNLRMALRGLAASATIITTAHARRRYGMVATAVMPVSMEPPSLVICVNRSASLHGPLGERKAFAVNILSKWDEPVASGFSRASGEARFAHGPWADRHGEGAGHDRLPYLVNAQAAIFCEVTQAVESGTHTLFIGQVVDVVHSGESIPLIYCDGRYGGFLPFPRRAEPAAKAGSAPALKALAS